MNMLGRDRKIENPRGSAIVNVLVIGANLNPCSEKLTLMSCIPLSLRIFSFAVLVLAFEACVSTACMD